METSRSNLDQAQQKPSPQIPNELKVAAKLLFESSIWPDRKEFEYFAKLVLYTHSKGWLWLAKEEGEVRAASIAYKVPAVNESTGDQIPEESKGNILYVPILVSKAKNKRLPLKMLKAAIKKHEGIKEVIYHKHRSNEDGKEKEPELT
jgi:hypothetical protein